MEKNYVSAQRRQADEPRACYGALETRCETEVEHASGYRCEHQDLEAGSSGSSGSHESVQAFKRSSMIMRNLMFCAMFAITAPFLLLGQELDKTALALPSMVPSQRWSFTGSWGNLQDHHSSSSSNSQSFQAVEHASKLGSRAMHVSSTTIHAVERGPQLADNQTISEESIANTGRHSLLSFGPFMFSVGLLVSIIVKLICAQPCAKTGTDMLHAFMRDQLEKEEALAAASSLDESQERADRTPPQPSTQRSSGSYNRGSGSDRWPCKLDLPDAPTPTPIKEAERASAADIWDTVRLEGEGEGEAGVGAEEQHATSNGANGPEQPRS